MGCDHSGADISGVKLVADCVMDAILRGDAALAKQVFHPDATVTGPQDGILVSCNVDA